jgi:hypothetical protein
MLGPTQGCITRVNRTSKLGSAWRHLADRAKAERSAIRKLFNPQLPKNNQREKGKNWSLVPDECLTPGRTGCMTVSRNMTLTFDKQAIPMWKRFIIPPP